MNNLPIEVAGIMDPKSTKVHKHRVLVLNMSCGESITNDTARESLLSGYVLFCMPDVYRK